MRWSAYICVIDLRLKTMEKLTIEDVEHIAQLSKLNLIKAEKEKFAGQLSSVLEYVNQLNEVDTVGVEPLSQVTGLRNVMVEDEITNPEAEKSLLNNTPDLQGRSIKVPAVFE